MSRFGEHNTKAYWEARTKAGIASGKLKSMIFEDSRFEAFTERVKKQLSLWHQGYSVLDVACGYGRFSGGFENYTGIDFCEEMVRFAKEQNPGKNFQLVPTANEWKPQKRYDVIFEVNSLRSLGMNSRQFVDKWMPYANKYIVTLECDDFFIWHKYENGKSW